MGSIQTVARLTQPNFRAIAKKTNTPQLITIPYSHFVELSRWSLQMKGIKFVEQGYAPGQHVLPVIATRLSEGKALSKSSFVEKVRVAGEARPPSDKKAAMARSTAVPLLVLPDSRVLTDSWEIVEYCGFQPLSEDLKDLYDKRLGVLARQWAYSQILKEKNRSMVDYMCTLNAGWLWVFLWKLGVGSYLHKTLCKIFQPVNAEANRECREKLKEIIQIIDQKVLARKGKYLNGDTISTEDLALCSLGSVLVFPPEYAAGLLTSKLDEMSRLDSDYERERDAWRATETGKYIMNFYSENRARVIA